MNEEQRYLFEALASENRAGDGPFSRRCEDSIRSTLGASTALLTPSCTAALEMCALLADIGPGDEVIMPSFTFSSTANAIVLRGGIPVFADVRSDTLNIDETLIEAAITRRTKAVVVVHYAGVCCEMQTIAAIARKHALLIVEDAAQAYLSSYRGRLAGTLADMAAFSFHDTKNIRCGEGGAFVTNSAALADRAEILREKGTNRSSFFRGEVDKYTWVDIGSSYLPSEFQAAVLLTQLQNQQAITEKRRGLWARYHEELADLEALGLFERPTIPPECVHNGQIYRLLLSDEGARDELQAYLRSHAINATFHFLPLHLSPAGRRFGRASGDLTNTASASSRLLRLPLDERSSPADIENVVDRIRRFFRRRAP